MALLRHKLQFSALSIPLTFESAELKVWENSMSDSFFRHRAGLYYDSDESFGFESDIDPASPHGNISNETGDSSRPVDEELDDFVRLGFLQSDEEDGNAYTANECDGSDSDGTDSPKALYV